jgi:FMS-like tyrosine kinase 1
VGVVYWRIIIPGQQLGAGEFGVVMRAKAIGITDNENVSTVAVKMVRQNAEATHIKALASELKIMSHLGKHLNVVNLLGACTKNLLQSKIFLIIININN